ncbi:cytochrome c oxidase assembly protein [Symbiobacterium thermophilum]|nr:cytochrome c oxidase assembly protein [Symbiobacterium thermophilum]
MTADLWAHRFEDLWYPDLLAWTVLLNAAYLLLVNLWRRAFNWGPPVPVWRQVLFCLGLWTVYLSEGTPIHIMSELYLFSVHMVQHTLLTMVMPPLILLGTPEWALRPLLRRPWAKRILRTLVHPVPALLLFNLIYSIWHLPVLYQAILLYHWFHAVQHAILVATALLMWWPVCSPTRELPPLSEPGQMVYVFLAGLAQIAAFAVITFADVVLYPFYEEAPRVFGIDPMSDQQLAGVVMHLASGVIFVFAWILIFFRWVAREDRDATPGPAGPDRATV